MGINLNNFLNSNLNQNIANTLREARTLKEEWRIAKKEKQITNVFKNPAVKDWLDNNEQNKVLFKDNREIFTDVFGKYHFTLNAKGTFYYVWKFNYNDKIFYLYCSQSTTTIESDSDTRPEDIEGFVNHIASYLK